jgi:uncharacterized protein YkwD
MHHSVKKLLALALLPSLSLSACFQVEAAAVFKDTSSHWAKSTIEWAASQGIVDGYADGTFKPDRRVSEPEFLAMLVRAYPSAAVQANAGTAWYDGFYATARAYNWTVLHDTEGDQFNRGHVAQLIASTQGAKLGVTDSVKYLLDHNLSDGKTSATVAGYAASDALTRAEAIQFLRNAKERGLTLQTAAAAPASQTDTLQVRGISIGDSAAAVTTKLGQPARKDKSKYGFEWYIYNQDLLQYTQVGVQDGKVVGLYTTGSDWQAPAGVKPAMTRAEIAEGWGDPLEYILKGHTQFVLQDDGESDVYKVDGAYVTFYYDIHSSNQIEGVYMVEEQVEQSLQSFYGPTDDAIRISFEREIFDLANAARAKRGLPAYVWNEQVAAVARLHSADMAAQGYFDHTNLSGLGPADRALAQGLKYRLYGENIAAGQTEAIGAHHGWLNSLGHRKNLLGSAKQLGTGVAFGGDMSIYYTQNFFTPY